jgi:hypothetical protein
LFPFLFDDKIVVGWFTDFLNRRTDSHSLLIMTDFIHAVQRTHKKVQTKSLKTEILILSDSVDNEPGTKGLGTLSFQEKLPDRCSICTASSAKHLYITSTGCLITQHTINMNDFLVL